MESNDISILIKREGVMYESHKVGRVKWFRMEHGDRASPRLAVIIKRLLRVRMDVWVGLEA